MSYCVVCSEMTTCLYSDALVSVLLCERVDPEQKCSSMKGLALAPGFRGISTCFVYYSKEGTMAGTVLGGRNVGGGLFSGG